MLYDFKKRNIKGFRSIDKFKTSDYQTIKKSRNFHKKKMPFCIIKYNDGQFKVINIANGEIIDLKNDY
jgi:hypothetical protein